jgi:uncharacterized protein YggL (DUF469 family)
MEFKRSKFSRRIRKKKRLGEFREYGFILDVYCGPDPEGKIVDLVIDVLIKKRLSCAGGGDLEKYSFFIEGLKEESDKEWIFNEIKKIQEVKDVAVYKTVDMWHDNADLYFEEIDNLRKEYGKKG